jgi:hypothetical protein
MPFPREVMRQIAEALCDESNAKKQVSTKRLQLQVNQPNG